jgi:hypothetical protein
MVGSGRVLLYLLPKKLTLKTVYLWILIYLRTPFYMHNLYIVGFSQEGKE